MVAKSNEIPVVRDLLACFDLTGAMVSVDAMHTQSDTATAITSAGGDYLFTVKKNQPGLHQTCKDLPWKKVPGHRVTPTGHGRRVTRTIKVVAAPAWVGFPGAAQIAQARRTVTPGRQEERRGRLPDHLRRPSRRATGHPRRMGPGPLGHREPAALGPRCHVR